MTYKELILMAKDAIDAVKAPFIAKLAQKDLEVKILTIEQSLAEADVAITNEKCKKAPELSWDKIIDAINKKELLERRLSQMKTLEQELFPSE